MPGPSRVLPIASERGRMTGRCDHDQAQPLVGSGSVAEFVISRRRVRRRRREAIVGRRGGMYTPVFLTSGRWASRARSPGGKRARSPFPFPTAAAHPLRRAVDEEKADSPAARLNATLSPSTMRLRSFITSSRTYMRYELIGWRRAGNFPIASHRRRVGWLTPISLAASAIVSRSAGLSSRRLRRDIARRTVTEP